MRRATQRWVAIFNRFLKINTCGEQRWINVGRVTRVSFAVDNAGTEMLAFSFEGDDKVMIHGDTDDNRVLIRRIAESLD